MGSSFLKNFLFAKNAGNTNTAVCRAVASMGNGLLRTLFGRDIGLFLLAPIALWAVVMGIHGCFLAQTRKASVLWLTCFGVSMASFAMYPDFRAGTCPAGRYQVIPAFLCAIPLTFSIPNGDQRRCLISMVLPTIISLLVAFVLSNHPDYWFRSYHPIFGFKPLQKYYDLFPSFEKAISLSAIAKAAIWSILFLIPFLACMLYRMAGTRLSEKQ